MQANAGARDRAARKPVLLAMGEGPTFAGGLRQALSVDEANMHVARSTFVFDKRCTAAPPELSPGMAAAIVSGGPAVDS